MVIVHPILPCAEPEFTEFEGSLLLFYISWYMIDWTKEIWLKSRSGFRAIDINRQK
jgi:hypothetical protein